MTVQQDRIEIRNIDTGTNPTRFARGWHCIGLAKSFRDGKPHQVKVFGTDLVVFADTSGTLHVLDSYCRHMGGNLARGEIKGDTIACPFHDWRWNGEGRCEAVPYARRTPKVARTKKWTTMERNGVLFVWNCPQGTEPTPELAIPEIEGYEDGQWSDWTWTTIHVEGSHCREIVDNVVDMAHFYYIHFAFPTFFKNVFEGHIAEQYLNTRGRPDKGMSTQYGIESTLESYAAYYGPSYMINPMTNSYGGYNVESVLINCHYPVTHDSFMLQYGIIVKKPTGMSDEQSDKLAAKFTEGIGEGFLQDVEIWKNKTKIENPLLCDEDGPVYQLRRWYEQFYVDVADVTEKMTGRFEFEVDTAKANESWEKEVAENLARKSAEEKSGKQEAEV